MAEDCPSKNDIAAVFKKLRSYAANKTCFDCGANNPTWSSVTYGVFICIDCSAVHRGLGVHLSFVRSTQLDTNWTWLQLRAMQLGGNSNAIQFFRQHGCTTTDAQQKYKSRAAQLYREKLHHAAVAAMRMHGTKLHIESSHGEPQSPTSPLPKDEPDFFAQHASEFVDIPRNESQTSISEEAYIRPRKSSTSVEERGPNVNFDDGQSADAGKSPSNTTGIIGQRRPPAKKTGNKKGAFGAQKVATDFGEIERQAEVLEKTRISVVSPREDTSAKDEAAVAVSARFLAQESAKRDEQLKRVADPKKQEQVERLGMALGDSGRGKASHSVLADIKSIQQEDARPSSGYTSKLKEPEITLDDEWDIISSAKDVEKTSNWTKSTKSEDWTKSTKSEDNGFFTKFDKQDDDQKTKKKVTSAGYTEPAANVDVQKKFGGAKAISSEQFFGVTGSADYETRTNLARFEGSNAISSADLFGGNSAGGGGYRSSGSSGYAYGSSVSQLPDVADIKDSVRQGVTKVAGKISQLSAGVSNYLSDHYGN